jgi:membrane-bound lytic murein transglycosylase D
MKYILLFALIFLSACGVGKKDSATLAENNEKPVHRLSGLNYVDEDSISAQLGVKLNIIQSKYNSALKMLAKTDTSAAETAFLDALEIISGFSEEERDEVQENPLYANILIGLDSDYRQIFGSTIDDNDSDRVLEEIGKAEYAYNQNPDSSVTITAEDSSSAFPLVVNSRVQLALKYFQTKGRRVMEKWLMRSGRYRETFQQILREEQVPEELFYIAMIESGFNNNAYSYASAVGPWQFMARTGHSYDLRNSWWFDERRDPIKATRAAAQHLHDLYESFGDWYLAMAGYNCSPRKVHRRTRIQNTKDFWKLRKLPRQTMNYVPTFVAAAIIAKNPEKYGFTNIEYAEPMRYDTVHVSDAIDLSHIAEWTDTTYAYIRSINPAVLRWSTPPGVKNFPVNIPTGTKEAFRAGLARIPESERISYIRYRIKPGDVLGKIAERFQVSSNIIRKTNKMRSSRIIAGKYLIIPVPKNKQSYYATKTKVKKRSYSKPKAVVPKSIPGREKVTYIVKKGDTIGQIAEDYFIRAAEIREWNGISFRSLIRPGQELVIFTPTAKPKATPQVQQDATAQPLLAQGERIHVVKNGDTLWEIARMYNTTIAKLKARNQIGNRIKPGDKLIVTK